MSDTKLKKAVSYHERISPFKSHKPLITWFCIITWQSKNTISPTAMPIATNHGRMITYHDFHPMASTTLWPVNFAGWSLTMTALHTWNHMILWSSGYSTSCDKLNTFYLDQYSVYQHQTNCNLLFSVSLNFLNAVSRNILRIIRLNLLSNAEAMLA